MSDKKRLLALFDETDQQVIKWVEKDVMINIVKPVVEQPHDSVMVNGKAVYEVALAISEGILDPIEVAILISPAGVAESAEPVTMA